MSEQENMLGKMNIELNFTIDEVNEILQTLAHLPFHQVAFIMKKIQDQAIPQAKKYEDALANVENVVVHEGN